MKATEINICVFTSTSKNKVFSFDSEWNITGINLDQLTANERLAYNQAEQAMWKVAQKDSNLKWTVWVCPMDYNNNIVPIEQQGFGQNLPALLITGYYSDGSGKQYPLKNIVGGGRSWDSTEIYKYIYALWTGKTEGGNSSIVCKLFPPLCNIGAYLWLGIAGVSAYKTIELKNNPTLQAAWGAGTLLALDAFLKGGGMEKIFKK